MQVNRYLKGLTMVMAGALSASVFAQDSAIDQHTQLIKLAASMNGVALACKENTQAQVDALYVQQRQAMLSEGVTAASYDATYAAALAEFQKKWDSVSSASQQKQCAQIKAMSQQAAQAAKQIEAQVGKK